MTTALGKEIPRAALLALLLSPAALAVDPAQVAQLGRELTPMGANPQGNADGSIPPYSGQYLGAPPHVQYRGSGTFYPSAYADEQPLFTITAQNYREYLDHLTEGQVALFKTYPDTFRMPVYPSKRDTRYSDFIHENAKKNALSARLVEGGNGITGSFEWKTEAQREIFVPYNNNALDDPAMTYAQLLTPHHLNPEAMRYELHRCHVVVGELKPGQRHIYGKRRLFLDEDSWAGLLADNYDRHGELFRTNLRSFVHLYDMPGMGPRVEVYHDLKKRAYQANNLVNELAGPPRTVPERWPESHFSPANLRMLGK